MMVMRIHESQPNASAATSCEQWMSKEWPQRWPPPSAAVYDAIPPSHRIQLYNVSASFYIEVVCG